MALTLPYPGMDFVPLDILTAAEQDQLVANIEYIANQFPIGTSNIDTNAVTSQKVDLTTFDKITVLKTSDTTSASVGTIGMGTTGYSVGTRLTLSSNGVKIGSGIAKVLVSASVFFNSSSKSYGWYEIRVNGNTTNYECIASTANGSYGTATLAPFVLNVSQNDVITIYNKEAGVNIRGGHATYLTVEVVQNS